MFIRYLTQNPPEHISDIEDFIIDAQKKQRTIFYSTMAIAEIKPSHFKTRGYGVIQDFFDDFEGAFEPIGPDPNIFANAARLRDAESVNPGGPREPKRVIGMADAIHLMTCLYVRDVLDVPDVVFHTFDKGKGATWEGKCIPLLGFEQWFPNPEPQSLVASICGLTRLKPVHPQPRLAGTKGVAP